MKPAWWHYPLAYSFPLSVCAGGVLWAGILAWKLSLTLDLLKDPASAFWLCSTLLFMFLMGCMLSIFTVWPLAGTLAQRLNGAPFSNGDSVWILSGIHRNRMARVYEIWEQRHQVRVNLGDEQKAAVTDVFSYHEICRARGN